MRSEGCRGRAHGVEAPPGFHLPGRGVYAGSTPVSFEVFGRHRGVGVFLDPRGSARPGATRGDT
jgi:hypothetical protein